MEQFCGTQLWNSSLTWNTTDPEFTPCFEKTVLVWIPCVYLWVLAPIETYIVFKSKDRDIPWSWLSISKLVISFLMVINLLIILLRNVQLNIKGSVIYGADYLEPSLLILSVILQAVFVLIERRRGLQKSGVLFVFWLLLLVCLLPSFRTNITSIVENNDVSGEIEVIAHMIFYSMVIVMLFVNCFGDKRPLYLAFDRGSNPCPEQDASFASALTFAWMDRLVWNGYKNPLVQDDLWDLPYECRSEKIVKDWEKNWNKSKFRGESSDAKDNNFSYRRIPDEESPSQESPKTKKYVSVLPNLIRTFGLEFFMGSFLKLISDLFQFIPPQILRLLIQFTEDENAYLWKGFFYAVVIFAASQLQSVMRTHYNVAMIRVDVKVRSSMVSAVYQKALKLSNSARKGSTVGEIVNLMSVDVQRLVDLVKFINMLWSAPMQIALTLVFLWQVLGPSSLAGLVVILLLMPVNAFASKHMMKLQEEQMTIKDERVKLTNEILNSMKVLKLYAWETSFEEQITKIRAKEVQILKKMSYWRALVSLAWTSVLFLVAVSCFACYSFVNKDPLTAQQTFVALALFDIVRYPISFLPMIIADLAQAKVSLDRMNKFMNSDELDPNAVCSDETQSTSYPVLVQNGTFVWERTDDAPTLKSIDLNVQRGSLVGVVGSVGAGKSSLCSALLGEMEKITGDVSVTGSVAYVAQQAWIQNATLKNNILFGRNENESRYQKVVEACALKPDIEMLAGGDETEIGEKGINLSGGQKQRVSLGRAVYSDSEIYLMDDPLSAVDSHVGKHIFENVIGPKGMLKDKTRILVTHGLTYLRHMDHIVVLKKGEISEQGSYEELIAKKGDFQEFLLQYLTEAPEENDGLEELGEIKSDLEAVIGKKEFNRQISRKRQDSELSHPDSSNIEQKSVDKEPTEEDPDKKGQTLIEEEFSEEGRVSSHVYKYYLQSMGIPLTVISLFMYLISQGFVVGSSILLSKWSEDSRANETSVRNKYLGIYTALGVSEAITTVIPETIVIILMLRASRIFHNRLLSKIMRLPMSFFDTHPVGRILSRFSKDLDSLDTTFPEIVVDLFYCLMYVVGTFFVICYATPLVIIAIIPALILYYWVQKIYIPTSRQLKRIESVSRSPIYSHFGETVQGAATIRAYNKCEEFILSSQEKVDYNQVSYYPSNVVGMWLGIRLEFLGNGLTFAAAIFAVLAKGEITGGDVGLSISYALQVTTALKWLVQMLSNVETNIVAAERIKEYTETDAEADWETQRKPRADWPQHGKIEFRNYSVRYREGLDLVVYDINFTVNPSEKIGIVGRTGAGKSSLTLGLFRIIEPASGSIVIDGVDIARLGLHDLRSKITVIPQDPVLFSGTLRMNLDPFSHYSDDFIWNSLEHAHLKAFVKELPSGLQHEVSEGGENLSVGQRQLVCLARALLRKTKILVLDEATAAVDMETDDLIQQTIRREFTDCTVLTIAHRLNTIMDSTRVLVLEKGQLKEFEDPNILLQDSNSIFYGLAKDAGLT